jgi:hypothetical protein
VLRNFQNSWFHELDITPQIWFKERAANGFDDVESEADCVSQDAASTAASDSEPNDGIDTASSIKELEPATPGPPWFAAQHIYLERPCQPLWSPKQTDIRISVIKLHRLFPIRKTDIRRYFKVTRKARFRGHM